mgnify:CR=1 FL=1
MSRIGIRATRELGALCGELRFRVVISDRPARSVLMSGCPSRTDCDASEDL